MTPRSTTPTYEARLRADLMGAYTAHFEERANTTAAGITATPRRQAEQMADVAMRVLQAHIDSAMGWGVNCTKCAHRLDLGYEKFLEGELAGIQWMAKRINTINQQAVAKNESPSVDRVLSSALRDYHNKRPTVNEQPRRNGRS